MSSTFTPQLGAKYELRVTAPVGVNTVAKLPDVTSGVVIRATREVYEGEAGKISALHLSYPHVSFTLINSSLTLYSRLPTLTLFSIPLSVRNLAYPLFALLFSPLLTSLA